MMFHNFSGGVFGKGHEQIAQVTATQEWFTALARKLYIPFLSETEFESIVDGKDLWIQSEDIRDRLKKMVAAMAKEQEAAEAKEAEKISKKTTRKKS
jgi:hypothetical protein